MKKQRLPYSSLYPLNIGRLRRQAPLTQRSGCDTEIQLVTRVLTCNDAKEPKARATPATVPEGHPGAQWLQRGWLGLQDSILPNYTFGNVAKQYTAPDSPRMSHAWKMRNNPFSLISPEMATVTKPVWENQTSEKYTKGSPYPWKMSPEAKESGEVNTGSYEDLLLAAFQAGSW